MLTQVHMPYIAIVYIFIVTLLHCLSSTSIVVFTYFLNYVVKLSGLGLIFVVD